MTDLISVIVTTWNREDALDAVLRSLTVQTVPVGRPVSVLDSPAANTALPSATL